MSAHAFRFDSSRLHAVFAPRKPRHPLARITIGLLGLAVLALAVVFSVFVGAAMLAVGLLVRFASQRGTPLTPPVARAARPHATVVDGEYRVIDRVLPSA